ncbi:hypothetical protein L804_01709 [Cryptococcus deuterogattii 2001/935-1]|nr:hypothetical protein L804_01709 [Cryptococcus deuterogattii 2001/935-1]
MSGSSSKRRCDKGWVLIRALGLYRMHRCLLRSLRFGRSHLRAVEGGDGWYLPVPLSWLRIAKSIYVIHITLVNGMMDRLIGSRSRILIIPRLAVLEEMDISM